MDNQAKVRQSMSESAHRRQMYQKLLETGSGINDSLEEEDLLKTLAKVNKLTRDGNEMFGDQKENEEPRQASEVVMDIQVLKMSNEIVSKSMKSKGMTDFYDDEFVNAIKELIVDANQQWSWQKLVPIWGKRMKQGSFYGYTLLGSFGEIVKKKEEAVPKQRAKRAKNTVVEEKKPENVAKLKQETKSSQRINDVIVKY
uniref:Non-structural maintenance of chromosomes element 4 n=1 Tax=Lutzomyia longipalpis TaxID=7200 RepID=A0A1B0CET2_LUTLO